jgi:hypothetical protein
VSSLPIYNVVADFSAAGNGTTDDTAEIQDAIDTASAAGGGTVYLPNGTYLVSGGGGAWGGCIEMKPGVTLRGETRDGAILKLAANQTGDVRVISADCDDAVIENLSVNGNKANQSYPDEHMAGIFLGTTPGYLYRCVVRDVTVYSCVGDGLDLYGGCTDFLVDNLYVHDCERSGIAFNGGAHSRLTIRRCQLVNNTAQCIDFESPDGLSSHVLIEGCYFESTEGGDYTVALSGTSDADNRRLHNIVVTGCTIIGATVIRWADHVRFTNNYCRGREGDTSPAVQIDGTCNQVLFEGNYVFSASETSGYSLLVSGRPDGDQPRNIVVVHNLIESPDGHQFSVDGVHSCSVLNNRVIGSTASTSSIGIAVRSNFDSYPVHEVVIEGNYVQDWSTGIVVFGVSGQTCELHHLRMTNNHLARVNHSTMQGYSVGADNLVLNDAHIAGNTATGVYSVWMVYPSIPVLIGGNKYAGGVYFLTGSPNGVITEMPGAQAIRYDTGALYTKTSGTITNTGWTAV